MTPLEQATRVGIDALRNLPSPSREAGSLLIHELARRWQTGESIDLDELIVDVPPEARRMVAVAVEKFAVAAPPPLQPSREAIELAHRLMSELSHKSAES